MFSGLLDQIAPGAEFMRPMPRYGAGRKTALNDAKRLPAQIQRICTGWRHAGIARMPAPHREGRIMLDTTTHLDQSTESVKAPKWRNLWVLKDGGTRWGYTVYCSRKRAVENGTRVFNDPNPLHEFSGGDIQFSASVSHFIPMPVL